MAIVHAGWGQNGPPARPARRALVSAALICWLVSTPAAAIGPFGGTADPYAATSSREAQHEAAAAIPLGGMEAADQARVKSVLADVTWFRRLPVRAMRCDPALYAFLVAHPDCMVNIWQVLGIGQVKLAQTTEKSFRLEDGEGTQGTLEYLYTTADTTIAYGEGRYEGPMLARPVKGKVLLVLKTGYVLEPDGHYWVTSRLDTFLQVEHNAVELLTKTFQPLVGRVADMNFVQTTAFLESLSRTVEVNEPGMQRLAARLDKVDPAVRQQFAQLSRDVAQRAAQRDAPRPLGTPIVAGRASDTTRR